MQACACMLRGAYNCGWVECLSARPFHQNCLFGNYVVFESCESGLIFKHKHLKSDMHMESKALLCFVCKKIAQSSHKPMFRSLLFKQVSMSCNPFLCRYKAKQYNCPLLSSHQLCIIQHAGAIFLLKEARDNMHQSTPTITPLC